MKEKKKIIKKISAVFAAIMMVFSLAACSGALGEKEPWNYNNIEAGNNFNNIIEKGFVSAKDIPSSSFSLSNSSSSYSFMRRELQQNLRLPDSDSVKIEELINYFSYDVAPPETDVFNMLTNVFDCPWNSGNKLLRVSLKAREVKLSDKSNNLVFLIDTSMSMQGADRLELVEKAFGYLTLALCENDKISIVTYASNSRVVLSGESGANKRKISDAIASLSAEGSSDGSGGIKAAYKIALDNYIEGGNNRVVIATDGDFNVGVTDDRELIDLIKKYNNSNIYLSCVGVGYGNYKDNIMENLATNGNGSAYYLDSESEAKKVFSEELCGNMITVANNAKAQVVFNPLAVEKYRLIGYDNKRLTAEQFDNPKTDAGEIGSGNLVTALYEIVPVTANINEKTSFASAEVRFGAPGEDGEFSVKADCKTSPVSGDDTFIACVAECGMLLRNSKFKANSSYLGAIKTLEKLDLKGDKYKLEFVELMKIAESLPTSSAYYN